MAPCSFLRRTLPVVLIAALATGAIAQDRLEDMPRFDRYQKLRNEIFTSVKRGTVSPNWAPDSQSFTYQWDGKTHKFDIATGKSAETSDATSPVTPRRGRGRAGPDRGRQFDTAISPDGKLKAVSRDRNVVISDIDGKREIPVTTGGSKDLRLKYGIASWVYGEELGVREAMWWSSDGTKLAFYKFDETLVKDYFLGMNQSKVQDTLDVEAYPKAGAPNPVVTLLVYDLASRRTTEIDTHFGTPELGEYVYDVRWAPSGAELLFNRSNRKQNIMELCASEPETGTCRVVAREDQPQSWAENHPLARFLKDNHRFIWSSEQGGYKNLYLRDLSGQELNPITRNHFDVDNVVEVNEEAGVLWYTARDGQTPCLVQLHRIGLDGTGDVRLTDPKQNHSVSLSPDGSYFVDTGETVSIPPTTVLRDRAGREVASLATSDISKFEALKLKKTERFTFTAADGKTQLYGTLQFPSDFDSSRKYPLLVSIYGGPESGGSPETFQTPNPITEFGFVVAWMDGRGTRGRGKAFRDALYGKLGVVEIDDQNAGVKHLAERPYIDADRVGIFGTSYGGYSSVMAILRHPETFKVACASSPVTDWLNYDSIYTERYDGLPWDNENKAGYQAGSAMTYAKNLTGKLMLYYGTADNNVHPSNSLQLIHAFERSGRMYDLQAGPDRGHSGMNQTRQWEYFVTHLILRPVKDSLALAYDQRKRRIAAK